MDHIYYPKITTYPTNDLLHHLQQCVDELSDILTMMVNRTRLESARSKVGEGIDAIIEESVLDILVDLESIFPRKKSLLTEHEEQLIINLIEERVKECINRDGR